MSDIFELAVRNKVRFETNRGLLSVEDLYDLNLTSLDNLAKTVNKKLKEETEESFIPNARKPKDSSLNGLKLDLLKHVILFKSEEENKRKNRAQRKAQLDQLKALAAQKATEALGASSLEDIQKMINELQASDDEAE